MKKWKVPVTVAICVVLFCAIFTGCVTDGSSDEEAPEVKRTVYLPATYRFEGEREIDKWSKEQVTVEKQFTYDDAGRCVRCVITEDSETRGHWVQTITFVYDTLGNVISQRKQSKSEKNGRVVESDTQYTIRYTYDENGRAECCEVERVFSSSNGTNETSGETYAFAYDKRGNLVTLTVGTEDAYWYYYSYDEQGRMIAQTDCTLLPEDAPQAEQYKYRYVQIVYERDAQGKVISTYDQYAYSTENVGAEGLDQLEYKKNVVVYTFYYDAKGNLTGVKEPDQYKYDENSQWIPEEKHETIKYRGETIDRLLAKYTQDEQGNIIKFENYQYTEEITYTALELTKTQAARAERFFTHPADMAEICKVPVYVFRHFYPDWHPGGAAYLNIFVNFFKNLPW